MPSSVVIPSNFGSGGSGLTPNNSAGAPSLKSILDDIVGELTDLIDGVSGANSHVITEAALVVAAHEATSAATGPVLAVQATTGDSAGVKAIRLTGSPSQGEVLVSYSAGGAPSFEFNATDNISGAIFHQLVLGDVTFTGPS